MNRGHRQAEAKSVFSTHGTLARLLFAALMLSIVTACGPGFVPLSQPAFENQLQATGYQAPDGKDHTGAGSDDELDRSKELVTQNGSESLSKADRELATSIVSARSENFAGGGIRVHLFRESTTQETGVTFEFTEKDIVPKQSKDAGNEVRYKSINGKNKDGSVAAFEAELLCRKQITEIPKVTMPGCQMARVTLKETAANGGNAIVIIRHQQVFVHTKSKFTAFKHETLKRLTSELQTPKAGELKSFEVGWGKSAFALTFGDSQICPAGRLVETNQADEPLRLNCSGTQAFRDLEGRMIGNSTRGELLLQLSTVQNSVSSSGIMLGDTAERLFLVIRQIHVAKKVAPQTSAPTTSTGPGTSGATPPQNSTNTPAPLTESPADEDDDDDDLVFESDKKSGSTPPTVKLPATAGWLIPINSNHAFTKVLANDRRHPAIERGIKTWLNGSRLTSFAQNFLPNRTLVTSKLAIHQVPAEFALILFGESRFFINKGYPLDQQFKSSAWGPWQFLDLTGSNNGLKINPRNVGKRFVPGNPCDERADLGKSTEAAGRYLRSIINMFPNDPKLVLLGYNQGEFGVNRKVTSLKNTESQERLAAIKEMGLNYWTIRRFNMASAGGMKYVENFVSVYHAALESDPVAADPTVEPWKPNPRCAAH